MKRFWVLMVSVLLITSCKSLSTSAVLSTPNKAHSQLTLLDESYLIDFKNEVDINRALKNGLTRSQVLARGGMNYLINGEYDKAQDAFNTALSFDIDNGLLHFLNAATYHQLYINGESDKFQLAEVGYKVASVKESILIGPSALQLGRLYLDAKRYNDAEVHLEHAIREGNNTSEVIYDYVRATALNGSWSKSRSAMNHLTKRKWDNPLLIKAKAIYSASFLDREQAKKYAEAYASTDAPKEDVNYLNFRINQLGNLIQNGRKVAFNKDSTIKVALVDEDDTEPKTATAAPVPIIQAIDGPSEAPPADANYEVPDIGTVNDDQSDPSERKKAAKTEPAPANNQKKNIAKWYRCDTDTKLSNQTQVGSYSIAAAGSSTDESTTAVTLPQACPGENPLTAIVEVTMLTSQVANTTASGVNLLDGLRSILTIGNSQIRNFTTGSGTSFTKTATRSWILGDATSDTSLSYSLNIANSGMNQTQTLSKPTMTIIDRVPSVFFSGSNISLGITPNNINAIPTVVDKTIGTSLAVTPTFIDENSALISIRATASGISSEAVVSSALLEQTRNTITSSALMKFGETLVLNGLRTKVDKEQSSGVPILQDFPLLQYFFKKSSTTTTDVNIITFITLRRPEAAKNGVEKMSYKALNEGLSQYIRYDDKDFEPVPLQRNEKLKALLKDLRKLVYY